MHETGVSPADTDVLRKHNMTGWGQIIEVWEGLLSHRRQSAQGRHSPLQLEQQESRPAATAATQHTVAAFCSASKWVIPELISLETS